MHSTLSKCEEEGTVGKYIKLWHWTNELMQNDYFHLKTKWRWGIFFFFLRQIKSCFYWMSDLCNWWGHYVQRRGGELYFLVSSSSDSLDDFLLLGLEPLLRALAGFLGLRPVGLSLVRQKLLASLVCRQEWTATGFRMISPSLISFRICWRELALASSLVSLGSKQTFLPQRRTWEASLLRSLSILTATAAAAKGNGEILIVKIFNSRVAIHKLM